MEKQQVVIIGGGAAGFFCASNINEEKYDVTILEQNNEVLQKVKISGGGRCNVTHACFDPRELSFFYPRGQKELLSVFTKFQPADTMEWFEGRKVPLKIEQDNRVFPESNSSQSIINCLINEVRQKGFIIKTKSNVTDIIPNNNIFTVKTKSTNYTADYIIFTTGSSPKAFKMLENLRHKIIAPVPSLFTFNIKNPYLEELSGTSFPNAEIKISTLNTEETGALLITHWGLSGPVILKLSAWEARQLADLQYQFDIEVNFIGIPIIEAEQSILEYRKRHPKKTIGQAKIFEITNRFWQKILKINNINEEKNIANLSKTEIQSITFALCKNTMKVTGKSTFKEEFVTAGGVDLKEINFKTMASKKLSNFYIAGEVLNIDAITGGFNFQACWSEAWLIAQNLNEKES